MIRRPWNDVFVLLTISTLAVASRSLAQQGNGSRDGLYAVPDSDQSASTAQESPSQLSKQSFLKSLDSGTERFEQDVEKAKAVHVAADSANKLNRPADEEGDTAWPLWIGIVAVAGLLVSLAASGYVWWSRTQPSRADGALFLAVKRDLPTNPAKPRNKT